MSPTAIFIVGVLTAALLVLFSLLTYREMRHSPRAVMPYYGVPPDLAGRTRASGREPDRGTPPSAHVGDAGGPARAPGSGPPVAPAQPRPLRILVATDGSPCSDRAVQSVAARPWPAGTQLEVVTVVHTRIPDFPDPQLMIEAAHVQALEADRQRAPERVHRAEQSLTGVPNVSVSSTVLEGHPADALLDEAERFDADLLVVGSHGYGPVTRRLLGSVSQAVALHAHCSVEIVRCPHGRS